MRGYAAGPPAPGAPAAPRLHAELVTRLPPAYLRVLGLLLRGPRGRGQHITEELTRGASFRDPLFFSFDT